MDNTLVSYIVVCYNQEAFLRDALDSAINQTYENIEYIFSDDCSSDSSYNILLDYKYKYPEKNIRVFRNDTNLGIGTHMNRVFGMGVGDLIVMASGDDRSKLNRVEVLVSKWIKFNKPGVMCSSIVEIDESNNSIKTPLTDRYLIKKDICWENVISDYLYDRVKSCAGSTMAYSRDCINFFPNFSSNLPSEDLVMIFRGMLFNKTCAISDKLMEYRRSKSSFSAPFSGDINCFTTFNNNYSSRFRLDLLIQYKNDVLYCQNVIKSNDLDKPLAIINKKIEYELFILELNEMPYIRKCIRATILFTKNAIDTHVLLKLIIPKFIKSLVRCILLKIKLR